MRIQISVAITSENQNITLNSQPSTRNQQPSTHKSEIKRIPKTDSKNGFWIRCVYASLRLRSSKIRFLNPFLESVLFQICGIEGLLDCEIDGLRDWEIMYLIYRSDSNGNLNLNYSISIDILNYSESDIALLRKYNWGQ